MEVHRVVPAGSLYIYGHLEEVVPTDASNENEPSELSSSSEGGNRPEAERIGSGPIEIRLSHKKMGGVFEHPLLLPTSEVVVFLSVVA